jgi:hypothetical protein
MYIVTLLVIFVILRHFFFKAAKVQEDYMRGFDAGTIVGILAISINQDIIGKEQYIQIISNNWMPWWLSTPMALGLLVIMYLKTRSSYNKLP